MRGVGLYPVSRCAWGPPTLKKEGRMGVPKPHVESVDERRGTILVAEDESALRRALARTLRAKGHEVIEATSGRHALELLDRNDVDVLLSDIEMPAMHGVDLLRMAHEKRPDVPVVLMTGLPAMSSALQAIEHGAFDYLTKPLDVERFESSIARAIAAHRLAVANRHAVDSGVRAKAMRSGGRSLEGREQLAPGEILADRYRILGTIGCGGMGTVYAAERQDLARMPVAIKVLHPELAKRKDATIRFRREAEVVASLHHPNIVNVLDFESSEDDLTFLVMELLRGDTLTQAIAHDPPFSAERAAFVAAQVLSALGAAHAAKIVHRDLKPDNVFLTTMSNIGDLVKVLDFGIAKLQTEATDTKLTQTGTVLGTPAYMAPEYARGEPAGALGDIYAVGCVTYEMLAKEPPFTGVNYNALLFAILDKTPTSLLELRPDLPPELVAVVETAIAKDPARRFQTAEAMRDALAPWLAPASSGSIRPVDSRRIENAPTETAPPSLPPSSRK